MNTISFRPAIAPIILNSAAEEAEDPPSVVEENFENKDGRSCCSDRACTITSFALGIISSVALVIAGMLLLQSALVIAGAALMCLTCTVSVIYADHLKKIIADNELESLDVRVNQTARSNLGIDSLEDENADEEDYDQDTIEENQIPLDPEDYALPSLSLQKKKNQNASAAFLGELQLKGDCTKRKTHLENILELEAQLNLLQENLEGIELEIAEKLRIYESINLLQPSSPIRLPQTPRRSGLPMPPPPPPVNRGPPAPPPPPNRGPPQPPPPPPMPGARKEPPPPPPPPSSPSRTTGSPLRRNPEGRTERTQDILNALGDLYDRSSKASAQLSETIKDIKMLLFGNSKTLIQNEDLSRFIEKFKLLSNEEIERLETLYAEAHGKTHEKSAEPKEALPEIILSESGRKLVKDYEKLLQNLNSLQTRNNKNEERIQTLNRNITAKKAKCLQFKLSRDDEGIRVETEAILHLENQITSETQQKNTRLTSLASTQRSIRTKLAELQRFAGVKETNWDHLKSIMQNKIKKMQEEESLRAEPEASFENGESLESGQEEIMLAESEELCENPDQHSQSHELEEIVDDDNNSAKGTLDEQMPPFTS